MFLLFLRARLRFICLFITYVKPSGATFLKRFLKYEKTIVL